MKNAVLFLILMLTGACANNVVPVNCCPVSVEAIDKPTKVKHYIKNEAVYKDAYKKCFCVK